MSVIGSLRYMLLHTVATMSKIQDTKSQAGEDPQDDITCQTDIIASFI